MIEKYMIESEDRIDIELAIKARDMYHILFTHQQELRSLYKYGKSENRDWEDEIERLYDNFNESLYRLGIEE